jgi:hypothetical protein
MADAEAEQPGGARPISKTEWERVKDIIEDLYMKEDKQLAEVMTIMAAEHQFLAK